MTTFSIEPFDALNGDTGKPCRVVGIDAAGLQPHFIVLNTGTDGWVTIGRTNGVERTVVTDADQTTREFYAERNARKSELGR